MTELLSSSLADQPDLSSAGCAVLQPQSPSVFDPGPTPDSANVLGVNVSAVNMDLAVSVTERWIDAGRSGYICVTGVHGVMEAQNDAEFLYILNHAAINLPDGMPMTWVGRLQGFQQMDRVFGPDFMMAICRLSVERGYRNFFYGGQPGVANRLSETLINRFPGLQVIGTFTPPFRPLNPHEEDELAAQILQSRPHIVWVGLSTPKQEQFMAQYVSRFQVPLMVGVGAAFDYHTGQIRDCSPWIKKAGLQWLHRLLQDPKRLWKRYLINNPAFIWRIVLQFAGVRANSTPDGN
jgi:N-acetylglucosaminyldiphosphoundecaprenol N-acetyl-beta-D-mannosaminyltransferase